MQLYSIGSDLLCAGEVPVPHMADSPGGELGDLRAVLCLHRAVPRTRVQERHCELRFHSIYLESFCAQPEIFHIELVNPAGPNVRNKIFCVFCLPSVINTRRGSLPDPPAAVCVTKKHFI